MSPKNLYRRNDKYHVWSNLGDLSTHLYFHTGTIIMLQFDYLDKVHYQLMYITSKENTLKLQSMTQSICQTTYESI